MILQGTANMFGNSFGMLFNDFMKTIEMGSTGVTVLIGINALFIAISGNLLYIGITGTLLICMAMLMRYAVYVCFI